MSTRDLIVTPEESPYRRILVYGDPGCGKTTFAASAPKPLLLDVENGRLALAEGAFPQYAKTPCIPITSIETINAVFKDLISGELSEFETIIIDTISELQKKALDGWLKSQSQVDAKRDPYMPIGGDYNRNTEQLRRLVIAFRDLPVNLILTAHVGSDKDEFEGRVYRRPDTTPKVAKTLQSAMDVIGYMSMEDSQDESGNPIKVRKMQIEPSRSIEAKSRVYIPSPLINPTFEMFLKAKVKEEGAE